jgi:hypothetical protein
MIHDSGSVPEQATSLRPLDSSVNILEHSILWNRVCLDCFFSLVTLSRRNVYRLPRLIRSSPLTSQSGPAPTLYRATSLVRKTALLGPYSRPMPRALRWVLGWGRFLMSEAPLYARNLNRRPQPLHLLIGVRGSHDTQTYNLIIIYC